MTLLQIYAIEPELKQISSEAMQARKKSIYKRHAVYEQVKKEAYPLIGWNARDKRLRKSAAWDVYMRSIVKGLRL